MKYKAIILKTNNMVMLGQSTSDRQLIVTPEQLLTNLDFLADIDSRNSRITGSLGRKTPGHHLSQNMKESNFCRVLKVFIYYLCQKNSVLETDGGSFAGEENGLFMASE